MSKKSMKTQLNKLRVVAKMQKRQDARGVSRTSGVIEGHYKATDARVRRKSK